MIVNEGPKETYQVVKKPPRQKPRRTNDNGQFIRLKFDLVARSNKIIAERNLNQISLKKEESKSWSQIFWNSLGYT